MTLSVTVLTLVVGALINIERKAFGPFLIARPLVAAPLLGAVAGNVSAGLLVAVPLELYFLASASYGAAPPPHETIAALFASAFVVTSPGEPAPALLACAVFASLPLAVAGRALEAKLERHNVVIVERAEAAVARGEVARAGRQALSSLGWVAFAGAAATALGLLSGQAAQRLVPALPDPVRAGLSYAWPMFLGMSVVMAARSIRVRSGWKLSLAGAALVLAGYGLMSRL